MSFDASVQDDFDLEDPGPLRVARLSAEIVVHARPTTRSAAASWERTTQLIRLGIIRGMNAAYGAARYVPRTNTRPAYILQFEWSVAPLVRSQRPSPAFLTHQPLPGNADFHLIVVAGSSVASNAGPARGRTIPYANDIARAHVRFGGYPLRDNEYVGGRAATVAYTSLRDDALTSPHEYGHGVFGLLHPIDEFGLRVGFEENLLATGYSRVPADRPQLSEGQLESLAAAVQAALHVAPPLGNSRTGEWGPRVDGVSARRMAG